jgi:hypothetical protein
MKKLCFLFLLSFISVLSFGQTKSAYHAYWQQEVRYQIAATLDTAAKRLEGYAVITYKNNSPDTLKRIYLQVPANAFFDEENTAVKEMRRFQGGSVRVIQESDYQLTVQSVQFQAVGRENDFPVRAFDFHDTILDLPLPALLLPGDSLMMSVGYTQNYKMRSLIPPRKIVPAGAAGKTGRRKIFKLILSTGIRAWQFTTATAGTPSLFIFS